MAALDVSGAFSRGGLRFRFARDHPDELRILSVTPHTSP